MDVELITEKNHRKYIEKIVENSVGLETTVIPKQSKLIPRMDFIKGFLSGMSTIATILAAWELNKNLGIIDAIKRYFDLHDAVDYMNNVKFKEYFERLGLECSTENFLMWSKVNIPSNNLAIMQKLIDFLIEDGFTKTQAWYAISASFGNDGLSLVAKLYGKDNIEDFLISNGYYYKREDGTKRQARDYFANDNEVGYAKAVDNLKIMGEEKGKGL